MHTNLESTDGKTGGANWELVSASVSKARGTVSSIAEGSIQARCKLCRVSHNRAITEFSYFAELLFDSENAAARVNVSALF
jgi:hypothetical protein